MLVFPPGAVAVMTREGVNFHLKALQLADEIRRVWQRANNLQPFALQEHLRGCDQVSFGNRDRLPLPVDRMAAVDRDAIQVTG